MNSVIDLLAGQLGQNAVSALGDQLGLDQTKTQAAISGALPLLIQALAKNTQDEGGASALAGALEKDHDGSVLEDVAGFLGQGGNTSDGAAILKHVLGGQKSVVESGLGKVSGLDAGQVAQVLTMLAPVVLGAVGKIKREEGLDTAGLAQLLGQEKQKVEEQEPDAIGVLGKLLDMDNDGDMTDDLVNIGGKLLGSFLK